MVSKNMNVLLVASVLFIVFVESCKCLLPGDVKPLYYFIVLYSRWKRKTGITPDITVYTENKSAEWCLNHNKFALNLQFSHF